MSFGRSYLFRSFLDTILKNRDCSWAFLFFLALFFLCRLEEVESSESDE